MTADGYKVILAGRERRRNSRTSGEGRGQKSRRPRASVRFASLHLRTIAYPLREEKPLAYRSCIFLERFYEFFKTMLNIHWVPQVLAVRPFPGLSLSTAETDGRQKLIRREDVFCAICWSSASSSALTAIRSPHYFLTCPLIWISSWSFPPDYSDFVLLAFSRSICHNINIHPPRRTQYYYDGVLP